MIASELSLARCRALLCFALAPLPSTNPAILRGAWCAYARSRPRRGHRRSRMIHNWGRFGGHKTTRKWVRTLITGHIFRSPARPPLADRPTHTTLERRLMAPAADSYCRNATRRRRHPVRQCHCRAMPIAYPSSDPRPHATYIADAYWVE